MPEEAIVPTLLIALAFVALITLINLIGISESVAVNVIMMIIELSGLLLIMVCTCRPGT